LPAGTKYKEIGRRRGMIANEHIRIDSNSYEKVKTFKYLGSLVTVRINLPLFSTVVPRLTEIFPSVQKHDIF
jgi:hypothetical protein